jgi:hypothetical protein
MVRGNIINSTISNVDILADEVASRTTLRMTLVGPSQTSSFCNITIPKSAVPLGTIPLVYVNNVLAEDSGYSQDSECYFVWYTTYSSTYELAIALTEVSALQVWSAFLVSVISVLLVATILFPRLKG